MIAMASLVGIDGADAGNAHALSRSTILGRQKGVDILVADVGASREHAKVFPQDGAWFVVDLGSRNGTKVNGKPVSRWELSHGDLIAIGKAAYRFDAPEIAAKAAPPPPAPAAAAARPAAAAARGPSAVERERERLRAAASRPAPSGRARADDGSGIVIKETVLQYGRTDDRGGVLKDDVGQRGPLFKIVLAVLLAAAFGGIVWGIVRALDRPPPDELEAPAPAR